LRRAGRGTGSASALESRSFLEPSGSPVRVTSGSAGWPAPGAPWGSGHGSVRVAGGAGYFAGAPRRPGGWPQAEGGSYIGWRETRPARVGVDATGRGGGDGVRRQRRAVTTGNGSHRVRRSGRGAVTGRAPTRRNEVRLAL